MDGKGRREQEISFLLPPRVGVVKERGRERRMERKGRKHR